MMLISVLLASLPLAFTNVTANQYLDGANTPMDMTQYLILIENDSTQTSNSKQYSLSTWWDVEGHSFENSISYDFNFNNNVEDSSTLHFGVNITNYGRGTQSERYVSLNFNCDNQNGDTYISNLYLYDVNLLIHYSNSTLGTFHIPNIYFNGDYQLINYYVYYNSLQPINTFEIEYKIGLIPLDYYNNILSYGVSGVYDEGYQSGFSEGQSQGYQSGYTDGYAQAENVDSTALTIFTGIINVGLLPVNFFLQILNFEVFGINIGAIVSATLTIAIVVIIIRVITGKKND